MAQGTCSVCGAFGTVIRGWCWNHYQAWRAHGDPLINLRPELRMTPEERFWANVDKAGPIPAFAPHLGRCWIWTASVDGKGYGMFRLCRRNNRAHRVAYEWDNGPILDGLQLDHLCRIPSCVRSSHLEPVTQYENQRRGIGTAVAKSQLRKARGSTHPTP